MFSNLIVFGPERRMRKIYFYPLRSVCSEVPRIPQRQRIPDVTDDAWNATDSPKTTALGTQSGIANVNSKLTVNAQTSAMVNDWDTGALRVRIPITSSLRVTRPGSWSNPTTARCRLQQLPVRSKKRKRRIHLSNTSRLFLSIRRWCKRRSKPVQTSNF